MQNQIKICNNCGTENEIDKVYCSCGKTLTEKEITDTLEDNAQDELKVEPNSGKVNSNKKGKLVLSSTKFVYLIFVLLIIGSFILVISGTFDRVVSVSAPVSKVQIPQDQVHNNVDLSNFKKINELEEFVKANPDNYDRTLELAHLLNDSQLNEKAILYYSKYLSKFPNSADVIIDLGVCYYESGQSVKAIQVMESALKVDPKHHIAHLNLGIVNMAAGNQDKATEWLQKAVDINPNSEIGNRAKELLNQH